MVNVQLINNQPHIQP